jgi:hypothetical protein
MAVAQIRYRVNKRKHALKAPEPFNEMVSRLSNYAESQPLAYADSIKMSITVAWKCRIQSEILIVSRIFMVSSFSCT